MNGNPAEWSFDHRLRVFVRQPGIHGESQIAVPIEAFQDGIDYSAWGLTKAVGERLLKPSRRLTPSSNPGPEHG